MKRYWTILRNHRHPVRFLAARLLMAARLSHLLVIRQKGYRLRFHRANVPSQLWIDPGERDDSVAFLRAYLEEGDRVVDVGANVGETVLAASVRVGPGGHVLGIEPHPRTFAFLQDNVGLNAATNVRLIHCAAGAVAGKVRFSDDRLDDMNRVGDGALEVAVERLDTLVPERLPLALLKVDVEGYEKFVFEGAPGLLERAACVYFETGALHSRHFGYEPRALLELLERAGFRLYRIADRALETICAAHAPERAENLVGLRDESDFRRRTGWAVRAG